MRTRCTVGLCVFVCVCFFYPNKRAKLAPDGNNEETPGAAENFAKARGGYLRLAHTRDVCVRRSTYTQCIFYTTRAHIRFRTAFSPKNENPPQMYVHAHTHTHTHIVHINVKINVYNTHTGVVTRARRCMNVHEHRKRQIMDND